MSLVCFNYKVKPGTKCLYCDNKLGHFYTCNDCEKHICVKHYTICKSCWNTFCGSCISTHKCKI